MKALAFASGKPVAPVSTLLALAEKLSGDGGGLVCPLLDAKKEEIYAGLFESGAAVLGEEGKRQIASLAATLKEIERIRRHWRKVAVAKRIPVAKFRGAA